MYVVTADQRRSRQAVDAVDDALDRLAGISTEPFERTAGDELQGIVRDAGELLACVRLLAARLPFRVGVGIGSVEQPVPTSPRRGRGSAFVLAREAVGRSRSAPQPLAVFADDPVAGLAHDAEAVLRLVVLVESRRSDAGHEVCDLADGGLSMSDIAARLGVTKQAVSQRLRVAGWHEVRAAVETCRDMLTAADEGLGKVDG